MKIEVAEENGGVVVRVSGCLDTAAAAEFKTATDGIAASAAKVTFDFSALEFIASSALRALVMLGKRLTAGSRAIAITGANEVVRDVFEATGLVEVFTVA